MNPRSKQGDLIAAIEPVADRLLKRYKAAQERLSNARERGDDDGASDAQDEINALVLFKNDMAAYPGPDLIEQVERGDAVLGGTQEIGAPDRQCLACGHQWEIARRGAPQPA
jgi:hypothetical protein